MGTITQTNSIAQILFGDTRLSVLTVFFRNPEQSLYLRQVIRLVGAGQGAVQRELKSLSGAGILTMTRVGYQVFFRANRDCPLYHELRNMILKTSDPADVLRSAFQTIAGRIRAAFVYGSFANGRYTSASDIDIMVIGDVSFADVADAAYAAQKTLDREINPSVYSVREFIEKSSESGGFLDRVVAGEKIFIIGDEHELAGLAGKQLAG